MKSKQRIALKFLLLNFLLAGSTINAFCQPGPYCYTQPDSIDGLKIFTLVDKMPEYKGGMGEYYRLLQERVHSPKNQSQGSIYIQFVVDILGNVRYECLLKRNSAGELSPFEDEALRVVKELDDWIPGENKGKRVPVRLTLPLKFGVK